MAKRETTRGAKRNVLTLAGAATAAGLVAGLAAGLAAGLGGMSAQARPLTPAEQRHHAYSGWLPGCADSAVLGVLAARFDHRERADWSSGLQVVAVAEVRETGLRSAGLDYIPRRRCEAALVMSDGKTRKAVYVVGEKLGFIGWGWGVEWCVAGLDRNLAWGADCRSGSPPR
jgi:hypothetical protein